MKRMGVITLVGVLSACSVGPDYQAPSVPQLPPQFSNAQTELFSDKALAVEWWRQFDDAQLLALIDQALAHNFTLQAARAKLVEARAVTTEAGMALMPQVSAHANQIEQLRSSAALNNRAFVPRDLTLYNAGFDAFWELDVFGRVRRGVEAAQDTLESQEASLRDVGVSLIAEVARTYMEWRGLQRQWLNAQAQLENQQQTLHLTERKRDNGRGSDLDVARALANLQNSQASLPLLQTAMARARHRLAILTGQLPGSVDDSSAPLPQVPSALAIGNPAQLLQRRPDIRSAERALAAATARIGVATADLFPKVTFVGSIALEASQFSGLGAAGADSNSFGPKISWAFLTLPTVYARIQAADARADAALAQYQHTVLNALEETENALVGFTQAQQRRARLAAAYQASQQARQLALARYQAGAVDFLTLLDAERQLLQAQQQATDSDTLALTGLIALYKALGGGWQVVATTDN